MPRILLVEDDQLIGQHICDILIEEGYAVEWERHGQHAAMAIQKNHYQLILLDSNLPKISGLELLQQLRSQNKITPVIILTAQADHEHRQAYMDAQATAYLPKPFNLEGLLDMIESLVTP